MSLTQINKAGLDEIALDHVFTIGASGSSAYTFQGEGLNGTVNNPTLYLTRGKTYRFENGSGGHPIRIQSTSGASGTAYNTGVTNNAGSGTVIVEVQHDAPDVLYYQCTSHAAMNGILYITGALADGGVTTAKIADDAITTAKIADDAVTAAQIANGTITDTQIASGAISASNLANNSVVADRIASNAVTTAKIASNAVTTTKIADSQITTAKINDSAVTTAKIAGTSVTTAKIANGAVTTTQIGDSSISTNKIQDNAVTTAKIADSTSNTDGITTAKIATGAVTTAKLATDAVTNAKLADQAVTLDKLPHGTSSNDGKFLRANNGADPTFESLPASGVSVSNNVNNRVVTGDGTNLNAEARLTFDGSLLTVSGYNSDNPVILDTDNGNGAHMRFQQQGSTKHYLGCGGGINMGDANDLAIRATDDILIGTGNSSTTKVAIYNSGELSLPYQPMFQARNSQGAHITISAGVIPFNTVINNVGSHYNNSNYRFTAPVAGVYLFYVGWFVTSDTNHRVSLRINGSDFTAPYIAGYSNAMGGGIPTFSGCQFIKLGSNDYVDCYSDSAFYPYGTHVGWGGYLLG